MRVISAHVLLCALAVAVMVLAWAGVATAFTVTGTNGDDTLFFVGVPGTLNTTITNPYTGESVPVSGLFNVNAATYDGLGGTDTLLMTNAPDALFLRDSSNNQTVLNMENIVAGNGNDVVNLADPTFTLGNMFVNGGAGDDILWGNVGADTLQGFDGNDIINGGPGNDVIAGGNGNDRIYFGFGSGVDTIDGGDGFDQIVFTGGITMNDLTITQTGPNSFDVDVGPNGDKIIASNIEELVFTSAPAAVSEPSTLPLLLGAGAVGGLVMSGLVMKRRTRL